MDNHESAMYLKDFRCPHCGGETTKHYTEKAGYFYKCPECNKKYKAKGGPEIPEAGKDDEKKETKKAERNIEKRRKAPAPLRDNKEAADTISAQTENIEIAPIMQAEAISAEETEKGNADSQLTGDAGKEIASKEDTLQENNNTFKVSDKVVIKSEEANVCAIAALATGILSAVLPFGFVTTLILMFIATGRNNAGKKYTEVAKTGVLIAVIMLVLKCLICVAVASMVSGLLETLTALLGVNPVSTVGWIGLY